MKRLIVLLMLIGPAFAYGQVGGEIAIDQRKITTDINYAITGNQPGTLVFRIAVDMEGDVTSCMIVKNESTIVSTPLMVKAKNLILTSLKFERGYHFPEFHQGTVTIEVRRTE